MIFASLLILIESESIKLKKLKIYNQNKMKNFTSIVVLCLLTISTNVMAQSKQPHIGGEQNTSQFKGMEEFNKNDADQNSIYKGTQGNVIELYDSIYYWSWDTLTNAYNVIPYRKIIDFVYDTNNRTWSYIFQNWNDTALGKRP